MRRESSARPRKLKYHSLYWTIFAVWASSGWQEGLEATENESLPESALLLWTARKFGCPRETEKKKKRKARGRLSRHDGAFHLGPFFSRISATCAKYSPELSNVVPTIYRDDRRPAAADDAGARMACKAMSLPLGNL